MIGKIREALKGIDLFGAEAIEMKPGAAVLIVLRPPENATTEALDAVSRICKPIADAMQKEGVRGIVCMLPPNFDLSAIDVSSPRAGLAGAEGPAQPHAADCGPESDGFGERMRREAGRKS